MTKDSPSRGGSPPPGVLRPSPRKASSQLIGTGVAVGHSNASSSSGICSLSPSSFHEDHRRELETVRSELEAERQRSQETRRCFALEARELRQAAERDRQLLADQLRSKWEQQRARELHQLHEASLRQREAEIRQLLRWKEAELREAQELLQRERDAAMRQARDLQRQLAEELVNRGSKGAGAGMVGSGGAGVALSTEGRAKLQEVLGKLRWEVDGEQAARIRHLKAELELERSLFLKYILERFEGEHALQSSLQKYRFASFQQQQPQQAKLEKTRPCSLESLIAARCSVCAGRASKSRSLDDNLSLFQSFHHQPHDFLVEGIPKDSSKCPLQPQSVPNDDFQRNISKTEESVNAPLEQKGSSWRSTEGAHVAAGHQHEPQGCLPTSSYDQLVKQNEELLKVLGDLEQRCIFLREENTLLRKSNFPEMQEKVKWLKKKNIELAGIARRLEERAKKLQESSLKVGSTSIPLSMSCSDVDIYKTSLAWHQAKKLSEQTKDQHLDTLQREFWELHTKLSTDIKNPCLLKVTDFDHLLRESQKEVLQLQRQLMLKNQREPLQHFKINSNAAASSVIVQETPSSPVSCLEDSSLPKDTTKVLNTSVEYVESKVFSMRNASKNNQNSTLKTDSDTRHQLQTLKEMCSEKVGDCATVKCNVEGKQRKYHDLELQPNEALTENVRIAEQNSQLHKKNEWEKNTENENAGIKVKLTQTIDGQKSAIQLAKKFEVKVEHLEQVIRDMKKIVRKQQQLESEHNETVLLLQKKEEEIKQMEQIQTKMKKEHKEVVQLLEVQVEKLENHYRSQTKQFNLQEFRQLQNKKVELIASELPCTICSSTAVFPAEKWENNCHTLHCCNSVKDVASLNSFEIASIQNSCKSCPNPDKDTANELRETETDKVSIDLLLQNQCRPELRVFLARYSYDPFEGPNKNPETELPLTSGEYVYVYGEMDGDGFYQGELMDGRRGMVPSNLVEEVSDNDLISFVPAEPSVISSHSYHEMGFPSQSTSSEEKSGSADEELCTNMPTSSLGRELCGDQAPVPCPQNLILIQQFAKSILVGWDPPDIQDNWGKVQSYNIYVNTNFYHNIKPNSQMKALIENLDLEAHSYQISVQSVTGKGNSDKTQCSFLVGKIISVVPTSLQLRSLTATSAEITWLSSNSNCTHIVYLNKEKYDETKKGVCSYIFHNLRPNSQYNIEVETHLLNDMPFILQGNSEMKSTAIMFTTPSAGPPNPPLDVQVQPNSSAGSLAIHWLPATIDSAGSSNGVKVTGYAIYANGQKVTEIMSPTAGSVSLTISQLLIFQESCTVSVRTISPFGESEDSVPALIPSDLLCISSSLLAKSVACTMIPKVTFKESLEHEDNYIATMTSTASSIYAHVCSGNTIHFNSKCKKSIALPASNTSPNHMFPSHNAQIKGDGNFLLHSSAWKQSSEHPFPAATIGGSANSIQKPAKMFVEDIQREGLEECKKTAFKSQSNNNKLKVYTMRKSTNKIVEHNSLQYHGEIPDPNHLGLESSISSPEILLKGSYRNVRTHHTHFWEESGENHMKYLCKKLSNLRLCNDQPEAKQVSRTERWHIPLGIQSHVSDLTDIEEKEYAMNSSDRDEFRRQKQPLSLAELTKDKNISMMLRTQQTAPSVLHSGSQISFDSGDKDCSERVFIALFDYDPITLPYKSEKAEEELSFKEGQILKVTSDKDAHGFYKGECEGKRGYIPCNAVTEIYIDSKEVRDYLLKKCYMQNETL